MAHISRQSSSRAENMIATTQPSLPFARPLSVLHVDLRPYAFHRSRMRTTTRILGMLPSFCDLDIDRRPIHVSLMEPLRTVHYLQQIARFALFGDSMMQIVCAFDERQPQVSVEL